tara:strand:+ start:2403 stop:4709 length:2307 start_codon:yes stop_codon:yes gene_type:complete
LCQQQRKKVPFFRAAPKTTWTLTMPSRFADEDDDMQNLSQLPRPQDKLTPLPDFVTSYHNPPDEFGNNISNSMAAPRVQRSSSTSSTASHTSPPSPTLPSDSVDLTSDTSKDFEGFQYQSTRRKKSKPSVPLKSGSSDEIRAMSNGMTELLKEKIVDLGNVMSRVSRATKHDVEPAAENELLNLAIEYLHMSDHNGPAASKKMQKAMLHKVDSLGKLAKRLKVDIPSDVDRGSDLYDLRSYYRGHRGVDIYAQSAGGASGNGSRKKKQIERPGTSNSTFQAALAALDPTEFLPDLEVGGNGNDTINNDSEYSETDSMDSRNGNTSSSVLKRGMGGNNSTKNSSAGALTLARQQLVRMQDTKRRRIVEKRTHQMRKGKNQLNKVAERFAVRALPNLGLIYYLNKAPPIELDSELIVGYVSDSMRIVEGSHAERVFRTYFTSIISRRCYTLTFWQMYLIYFQNKAKNNAPIQASNATIRKQKLLAREKDIVLQQKELKKLSERLAATYVQLLGSIKVDTHKPVFYRYYSTALSEAIYQTLYFYFPGSRNLYNNAFKTTLLIEVSKTLSGMPIYPVSAAIMSASVFGHVIIQEDNLDLGGTKKKTHVQEPAFGGALPAGHSTKSRRFDEPSIWIPTGKRPPKMSARATHMSPLVRHFLKQPMVGHLDPLPTKRSKPTTTRYRLPNAFKMIGKAEDRMMELRANYNFKMNQFEMGKRWDRNMVKEETKLLEEKKHTVLFSKASDRQRYAFHILDEHKKALANKKRENELKRL